MGEWYIKREIIEKKKKMIFSFFEKEGSLNRLKSN